jgi:hypothetical protein
MPGEKHGKLITQKPVLSGPSKLPILNQFKPRGLISPEDSDKLIRKS